MRRTAPLLSFFPPPSDQQGGDADSAVMTRVPALAAPPEWLRNHAAQGSFEASESFAASEEQFWNQPASDSVSGLRSLPPLAAAYRAPSRARRWGARLLAAAVLAAVFALLALEAETAARQAASHAAVSDATQIGGSSRASAPTRRAPLQSSSSDSVSY